MVNTSRIYSSPPVELTNQTFCRSILYKISFVLSVNYQMNMIFFGSVVCFAGELLILYTFFSFCNLFNNGAFRSYMTDLWWFISLKRIFFLIMGENIHYCVRLFKCIDCIFRITGCWLPEYQDDRICSQNYSVQVTDKVKNVIIFSYFLMLFDIFPTNH